MRKIIFRGKTEEGKWVKGAFIPDALESIKKQHPDWGWIKVHKFDEDKNCVHSKTVEVIRSSVGMYTGIRDEDGKRIYEGAVLQRKSLHKVYIGKVVYREGAFVVDYITEDSWDGDLLCMLLNNNGRCKAKVIGNVFDNPELLVYPNGLEVE